jgi:hypothetical protein
MRRATAALLSAVVAAALVDSHVDWETVDGQALLDVDGTRFDPRGWARDRLAGVGHDCAALERVAADSAVGASAAAAVARHSPPDSAHARWHQALQQGPWLVAELSFERLSPAVALLQRRGDGWQLHPTAIWSGSTAPWNPAPRIRDHLRQQAPDAPEALLACFRPLQDFRAAALLRTG